MKRCFLFKKKKESLKKIKMLNKSKASHAFHVYAHEINTREEKVGRVFVVTYLFIYFLKLIIK